jgi:hypothetical protein
VYSSILAFINGFDTGNNVYTCAKVKEYELFGDASGDCVAGASDVTDKGL